ncbi:MAG: hypothetical protein MRERV_12c012 [Mycoplasmataceae bacterium RV_VA103A]|nr:MAG: hypothetical protein MRERV_12c012 [Mycoplasmataceae bacterium RV_VA103A]
MNISYFKDKLVWIKDHWMTIIVAFLAITFVIWLLKKLWSDIFGRNN